MFFRLASKLRFLWCSTNQHGVHSPFVFNYLTQGIYKKPAAKKEHEVLLKSISYFNVNTCYLGTEQASKLVRDLYPDLRHENPPYDLIYLNIQQWQEFYQRNADKIHNNTAIILYGIYHNRETKIKWETWSAQPQFNVSIDMFHCGVLFIREEQRKQHFKVRI
ncbi:hypothetical protein [Muriicola sp. Z0-33]|uniref:hypothetical protein n=1 Tax=Muriicola sp. Z0-33 TaxID=2816957 RepID=UPI002237B513|nr:hypothetical protein [Muriicola sp. Z0-33]MCW5515891.1 hypothetical protein [Muriicola sp. Z0-33]